MSWPTMWPGQNQQQQTAYADPSAATDPNALNMAMYSHMSQEQQYSIQQQNWQQWQVYQQQLASWQAQYGEQVSFLFRLSFF